MIRTDSTLTVLGVDQATSSGWCIHVGTRPLRWGTATDAHERKHVVELACDYAMSQSQQRNPVSSLVFVFEDHAGFARVNGCGHGTLMGALHRWFEHLDLCGHPESMRIGIAPSDWQKAVLGVRNSRIKSAERKRQSMLWASHHVGAQVTCHDQADGIAISACGALTAEQRMRARAKKRR